MTVITTTIYFVSEYRWYLVAAIIVAYLANSYRQYCRLKAFNGPWLGAWTDLWFFRAVLGIKQHEILAEACEKYGSIARIGPNTLVTNSPDLVIRMRSLYRRSDFYAAAKVQPGKDNTFSQMDEEKHTRRRAQMADGYSGKTNPPIEHTIQVHVKGLIDLLRRKYLSTADSFKPVDRARKASFFTMDVITDVAFAKPFGNL